MLFVFRRSLNSPSLLESFYWTLPLCLTVDLNNSKISRPVYMIVAIVVAVIVTTTKIAAAATTTDENINENEKWNIFVVNIIIVFTIL